jgi:hypothetical protein
MPTVTIDSAWLAAPTSGDSGDAAHGWLLQRAGYTYILDTDVRALATAFIVGASDITFNKNGHEVLYNDAPPLSGVNWDFEADAIGSATCTGWVLTGAPQSVFTVRANDCFLFGSRVLQWRLPAAGAGMPQTIESSAVAIPEANRTYTASISATRVGLGSQRGQSVGMDVYDSVTRTPLANVIRRNGDVGQGEAATLTFLPTTTNPVYFVVSHITGSGSGDSIMAVDRLRVTRSCDHGVIATEGGSASMNGGTGFTEMRGSGVNTNSNLLPAAVARMNKGRNVAIIDTTTARATATIDATGRVNAISVTAGGDYEPGSPPRVLAAGGGLAVDGTTILPARLTAVLTGRQVTSITIDDSGGRYVIPPGIIIEGRGAIRQGQARGAYCSPLALHEQKGTLLVDGVKLYASGDDVHVIRANYGGATVPVGQNRQITRTWIEHATDDANVTIRANQIAAIYIAGGGYTEVSNCAVFDSPHTSVRMGSYAGQQYVHDCWFSPRIVHTNGYTLKISGSDMRVLNLTIGRWEGNTFAPAHSARGWLDEPESGKMSANIEVGHITADTYEYGNREYGVTGTPTRIFRFRNLATGALVSNRNYHDLSCTARTRADMTPAVNIWAVGGRLNITNWGGNDDANIRFRNILFRAVIEGDTDPGVNYHATAFVIDNFGGGMRPILTDCRLESSEQGISLSGSDAASNSQVRDVTFRDTIYTKLSEGYTERVFVSHSIGYTGTDITNCNFYGNTYVNGAVHRVLYRHSSTKSVGFGERLQVLTVDGSTAPVAGALVQLTNNVDALAESGTTDAEGVLDLDVVTVLYTGTVPGPAGAPTVVTPKWPHTVAASAAGHLGISDYRLALLQSPTGIILNLDTGGTMAPGTVRFPTSEFMATMGGPFTVTVSRQGSTQGIATVHYATSDGTATAGMDYTAASGDLSFADGQASQTFTVTVLALPMGSGNRTVNLILSSPSGATLGTPATSLLTLVDQGTSAPVQRPILIVRPGGGGVILISAGS